MEILNNLILSILNDFDFTYCIIVNILTYICIKITDEYTINPISIWTKRLILLIVIIITGIIYYSIEHKGKVIINSAILAPVFWSWIMKPICNKLKIDYKQINDCIEN